jgi:hypothetical protein
VEDQERDMKLILRWMILILSWILVITSSTHTHTKAKREKERKSQNGLPSFFSSLLIPP